MTKSEGPQIVPWDDHRGDVNWVVMDDDGRILSRHESRLSAQAAVERLANPPSDGARA